ARRRQTDAPGRWGAAGARPARGAQLWAVLMAALIARTPTAGPSGWPQTPPMIASRLAPARTSGARLAAVMPPMAHEGTFDRCAQRRSTSGSARFVTCLEVDGKDAPNAT